MKRESKAISVQQALTRLSARCSQSEHCEADLRAMMKRWGIEPDDADGIVARLRQEGFINDERYVRAFVHDRLAFNGWGVAKVKRALQLKGFSGEIVDNALADANTDDYRQRLFSLLSRRKDEVASREPRKQREAVIRAGLSRGYEPALVFELVNKLFIDNDETIDGNTDDDSWVD